VALRCRILGVTQALRKRYAALRCRILGVTQHLPDSPQTKLGARTPETGLRAGGRRPGSRPETGDRGPEAGDRARGRRRTVCLGVHGVAHVNLYADKPRGGPFTHKARIPLAYLQPQNMPMRRWGRPGRPSRTRRPKCLKPKWRRAPYRPPCQASHEVWRRILQKPPIEYRTAFRRGRLFHFSLADRRQKQREPHP